MGIVRKATLATVLAATTLTSVTPAMADPYYRGRRGGGDTTGAAIAGGIIGLALGAIIASSASNRGNRYADRGWTWRDGYYWDRQGRRFDRDGRPCDDDGYYDRRGYSDRGGPSWGDRGGNGGWNRDDRGYYGRDNYYGEQRYRYGN